MILMEAMTASVILDSWAMDSIAQVMTHMMHENLLLHLGATHRHFNAVTMLANASILHVLMLHADVDECYLGVDDCNVSTSFCVNNFGAYSCECIEGFNKTDDGICTCENNS